MTSQQKKQWLGMLYYPVSTGDGKPALDALEQDMRAAGMRFHTADNGELLLYPAGAF